MTNGGILRLNSLFINILKRCYWLQEREELWLDSINFKMGDRVLRNLHNNSLFIIFKTP